MKKLKCWRRTQRNLINKSEISMEKGITLVSLIITIVLLLILASVTISSIQGDGVLEYAINAADSWNIAQANQQNMLGDYLNYLNDSSLGGGVNKGESREGQKVKYDSDGDGEEEDWIILTDKAGLVEIVSADIMGEYITLGRDDPEIKGNILKYLDLNDDGKPDDLNGDGKIEGGGRDFDGDHIVDTDPDDIAIASYNNAITTINNYCKSLVKEEIRDKVRSVGYLNDNFVAYHHSTIVDNWGKNLKVDIAAPKSSYKTDYDKMSELGILKVDSGSYWMADYAIGDSHPTNSVNFNVVLIDNYGDWSCAPIWKLFSDGDTGAQILSARGVRLVIVNPPGI